MDLKSNKISFFALAIMMFAAALLGSCGSGTASAEASASDNDTTEVDEVKVVFDSVSFSDKADFGDRGSVALSWKAIVPATTGGAYADSIRDWVVGQFGCDLENPNASLDYVIEETGKANFEMLKQVAKGLMAEDDEDGGEGYDYVFEDGTDITILYEDDEYITMVAYDYAYDADIHAQEFERGVTFRKSDGHVMGWDLFGDMTQKEINSKILDGLVGYFELESVEDLYKSEYLFDDVVDADEFPMPETAPYLVEDGVVCIYQQYEIAPYEAGMPNCVIKVKR